MFHIPLQDGFNESLFVVDTEHRLAGVLSHTDILEFILRSEQNGTGGGPNGVVGGGARQPSF